MTFHVATGHTTDGAPRLTITGEIDLGNAAYFGERLTAALEPGHRLLVDLTGVDYLDSAGLAVLFAHADHIEVEIAPLNRTLLRVSGLGELTTVRVIG